MTYDFSFNSLGNRGHLGVQMFQYAFIRSMSVRHNAKFSIPKNSQFNTSYPKTILSNLDDCFSIDCRRGTEIFRDVRERQFHYDEDLVMNLPYEKINFLGYFQSEKYFKNIEKELREKDFSFKSEIITQCADLVEDFQGSISLHVRRNDFIGDPNHPIQDDSYYLNALESFSDTLPVVIFTDDIEWCKEKEIFTGDRFTISETNNSYCDLYLMSQCSHHILSNSAYSWWGAWLANSKNVVAPRKWFGGECSSFDTTDLYLPHWSIL